MVLAFLGGFLQQLLGPKKMLLAAALPGLGLLLSCRSAFKTKTTLWPAFSCQGKRS